MQELLSVRQYIYDQFQESSAGPAYFFLPENADSYATYYTSMYLIQDTGEAIHCHVVRDFSSDPLVAYLEFWGVMQAFIIQQDAISELHRVIIGDRPRQPLRPAWKRLRVLRNTCAGHPSKRDRGHGVTSPQRSFLSRSFGKLDRVQYEHWDSSTDQRTHPVVNLRQIIEDYDKEASAVLDNVLSTMKSKWK